MNNEDEWSLDFFTPPNLIDTLYNEYKNNKVFPKFDDIFKCFSYFPPSGTKVVIIGQDPYFNEGQATGLAFAVSHKVKCPPSLVNIMREIDSDIGGIIPQDFSNLPPQGVLLLNRSLTVQEKRPNSHVNLWKGFCERLVTHLSIKVPNLVFILWGNNAQSLIWNIEGSHLILKAPHPSPLSAHRGFLGCKHFSKCNKYLESKGKKPIQWVLT